MKQPGPPAGPPPLRRPLPHAQRVDEPAAARADFVGVPLAQVRHVQQRDVTGEQPRVDALALGELVAGVQARSRQDVEGAREGVLVEGGGPLQPEEGLDAEAPAHVKGERRLAEVRAELLRRKPGRRQRPAHQVRVVDMLRGRHLPQRRERHLGKTGFIEVVLAETRFNVRAEPGEEFHT